MTLLFTTLLILHHAILSSATMTATTFKQTLLDDHNAMRTKVASGVLTGDDAYIFPKATDMIQLKWSDTIAAVAQSHAEGCVYAHSTQPIDGYGENIAITTATWDVDALKDIIKAWLDNEAVDTKFTGSGVNYGNLQCSDVCGHFTQGIWAKTAELGCGYYACPGTPSNPSASGTWKYLVCNYFTRGNIAIMQNGNVINSVYTTGTSSCTTASCPTGYKNCVNHLCAASTSAPTSSTSSPTRSPTDSPVVPPSNPDIYFCNYNNWNQLNGAWQYDSVNRYTKNTGISGMTDPFVMYYNAYYGLVMIRDGTLYWIFAQCTESTISSCAAGKWQYWTGSNWAVHSTAYISSSACPATAQSNNKLEATHSFKASEQQLSDNKSYPLNMTEMHIILGVLILVLITMCGMIFGFCYYVKKNNKNEKQIGIAQENEMVYFESEHMDKHNTPTNENVNDWNQNQPSLKINVNGTATMVTKLPTTTPVSPLINLDQNYE